MGNATTRRSAELSRVRPGKGSDRLTAPVRRRKGGELVLVDEVARVLAEAVNCADGLQTAIRVICEAHGWSSGTYWRIDDVSSELSPVASWPLAPDASLPDASLPGAQVDSGLLAGLGGDAIWIRELLAEERAALCMDALKASAPGVVLPVRTGGCLSALIAFEIGTAATPDSRAAAALQSIAALLGLFCEKARTIEQLAESKQRYASTLALAAVGIAHVEPSGRFLYANPRLCRMLGYSEAQMRGLTVKQVSHPDDENVTDELHEQLRRGEIASFKTEKRYLRADGSPLWVSLTVAMRRDRAGEHIYDISIVEDISARKLAEERVEYMAMHDGLTGLPNRAMFSQLLSLAIDSAKRRGCKIAVLFIDIDRFKIVNDTLGHEAGDVLLRELASRFRDCLRASDVVARLGGDEFVALLPEISDQADVAAMARHLLSAAMRPVEINQQDWRVTASIGICVHPQESQDDHAVMKNADMAMYLAKEEGKNTYKFYSPHLRKRTAGGLAVESQLRQALERGEFSLHYQPKVRIDTDTITGVEALLRWHSPSLGQVSPVQFIPIAEEMGLIIPLGRWVLRTACMQAASWQREGLPPMQMCVNLSMRQLMDDGLIEDIQTALRESGLPAQLLELELTESMIMRNAERAMSMLTRIKSLGVGLAIDDFGTGYSSLAQLKRYPVDTLKVDRSFIRDISSDPEDRAITEAILTMGKTLSLNIVAEGVETEAQKRFLSERACHEMQGYYVSTPVPPAELTALLRTYGCTARS